VDTESPKAPKLRDVAGWISLGFIDLKPLRIRTGAESHEVEISQ